MDTFDILHDDLPVATWTEYDSSIDELTGEAQ
jgi:hypothetical protein